MKDSDLTPIIIGVAIDIHRALGPGLLEAVYERSRVTRRGAEETEQREELIKAND